MDDEDANMSHMVLRKTMPCCSVIPNVLIFYSIKTVLYLLNVLIL